MEVQFRDISYEAEVLIGSAGLPTVGKSLKNLALVTSKTSLATQTWFCQQFIKSACAHDTAGVTSPVLLKRRFLAGLSEKELVRSER